MSLKLKIKGLVSRKDVFFLLIMFGALLIIVGLQQLLPSGKPLPFGRVNGEIIRISSNNDIIDGYRINEERKLTLVVNDYHATYKLRDLGVTLQEEETVKPYLVQSRLMRLIPFSVLAHMYRDNRPVYTSSRTSLLIVTAAIADEVNVDPANAEIIATMSAPQIKASQDGVVFEPSKALITIFDAIADNKQEVVLASKVTEADIVTNELETAVSDFTKKVPEAMTIIIGTEQKQLDRTTLLSWLSYEAKDGLPVIGFNQSQMNIYAETLSNEFAAGQQPTATLVSLVDGKETGRLEGSPGKTILADTLTADILSAVQNGQSNVTAKIVDVPSPIKYARSYTRSSVGLKEMLDQITTGKEISVRFVDVNSRGWDVGSRSNTRSYMASTYKLFVAYSVLKRIDAGSMSFGETINGKTIDACLQTMIIDSDNDCAIAMAERIGWITIQNEGKALGATGLDWSTELAGSTDDAVVIPRKLASGEILTIPSRDYLIDLMKRQRFRSGIPAGSNFTVADKVGFYEGWLNDTGIVYANDMPYVLAIYTKNESWATLAEITRQIESLVR